jgi:MtaA/CmuA family methyltransferase
MLTAKERLKMTLAGEKTDRKACICPGGMMNMVTAELMEKVGVFLPEAHTDARKMADLAMAVCNHDCFENAGVPFCMTIEAEELGASVDLGTNIYEPHVTEYPISSVCEWNSLTPVQLSQGRSKVVLDAIRMLKEETEGVPIVGNLTGPVSVASSVLEPVTFYKELRKKNREAHEFMDYVTEQLIAFGRAQIEAGADIIAVSDPSGTGEILGPKYFEEFAVTYINKLLDALQKEKMGTIVHICGQMKAVYDKVANLHSDIVSFDAIVSLKEVKKHLGNKILMGNVSTYTLEFGDTNAVKRLTRACERNGSDILAPACGLGMTSPLKNVQAILECLKEDA